MEPEKRVLIVGGVAGGASCAARARRLSEKSEIILFEKGPFVSFANCGLPFHIGEVIEKEESLLVATPGLFKKRFKVDVRLNSEVLSIDRAKREIQVKELESGRVYSEKYDALVLSPGAAPIKPPIAGADLPGIFTLRSIPDTRDIRQCLAAGSKSALIVGGGFIGLEMAENLVKLGQSVTLVEAQPQVMSTMDPEMVSPAHDELRRRGVSLRLGDSVTGFDAMPEGGLRAGLASGEEIRADIVILAIGVRPETKLARDAGLEIGELGGIRVDDRMVTSDPRIWAVGDAVEVRDVVTGRWTLVPLAGPANRQGRIAADVINGRDRRFRGVQATAVCGVFDLTIVLHRTRRKDAEETGAVARRLREDIPPPGTSCGVLSRRQNHHPEADLLQKRRAHYRMPGGREGGCRKTDRRHFHGHAEKRDRLRSGGSRTLLRASIRLRKRPGEFCGDDRGKRGPGRYPTCPVGRRRYHRGPHTRRSATFGIRKGTPGKGREHSAARASGQVGRIAPGLRNLGLLQIRTKVLLCGEDPFAIRV